MEKLEIVKHYKTIIECEQLLLTGSLALNLIGFKCKAKDIDLKVVNPSESSINMLKKLSKDNPPTNPSLYPDSTTIRFKHDDVDIDIFIEKSKIETSIITKSGIEVTPLDYIVKAKKSMKRPKDFIQLRNLSREVLKKREIDTFMDNYKG